MHLIHRMNQLFALLCDAKMSDLEVEMLQMAIIVKRKRADNSHPIGLPLKVFATLPPSGILQFFYPV